MIRRMAAMTKRPKIASGTTARSTAEWIGETPDVYPPLRVRNRVWERQDGRCAITGKELRPGDGIRLDHIKPVIDGGENRESNLQWLWDDAHKIKTAFEASARAKARRRAASHAGIKLPTKRKIASRGFPEGAQARERTNDRLPLPQTPGAIARQFKDDEK